ncbi:RibD family protein [Niallia taxi]|uniref:RibD family protein n=1 Tax=Niallia taxi TaxID=2499688 RepID=UPI002E201667|nr:RibD family protein [Niallia taxi]
MEKPYVICHMMTSIDGKIIGDFLEQSKAVPIIDEYERTRTIIAAKGWMCGRVTFDVDFLKGQRLDLSKYESVVVPSGDFIADTNSANYAIAVDPSGKLAWSKNTIDEGFGDSRTDNHIIEIVTNKASSAYLAYLREKKISYILAGENEVDFKTTLEKLYQLFNITSLTLEGGGSLNGSFFAQGLIDEISVISTPVLEGTSNSITMIETPEYMQKASSVWCTLISIDKLSNDALWLRYKLNKE